MRNLRNSVKLIGRLGKDPEIIHFDNGNSKAVLSIATDDSYKNKDGEKVEKTDWHKVTAFGANVEIIEKYIKKGKEVCIEGKLSYNVWEDKDGKKHYYTDIIVNDLLML